MGLRNLERKKTELENIIEYRTKGAILRSKCRWYNEGERNTKYFLNMEKRHYKQGVISQLKINDDETVNTDKEILNQCESFYRNLYSSHMNINDTYVNDMFFDENNTKVLNPDEQISCEGLLTKEECLQALKSTETNKTPGSDGIPAEFYKVFWNDLSDLLVNSINFAYQTGQFSVTQRRGIIKLIPKKDAEPYFIKNWRPITLLNCDYKIATKAIANRLKKVLPNLVDNDQTGFLKDRFIGENIRLIDSIIHYATANKAPGLLLFLDFEKAFDTVEWPFIQKTFKYYNFGQSLINWIKLCYHNTESCILNNGWASDFFKLERGVRQGCPLSPYLFILCVEVLADAIRKNQNVKGIFVNGNEIKISQYADDTTLILDGSKESLASSLHILDNFQRISGLKLNNKKTEALWIGANAEKEDKLCPERDLKWVKGKTKALGVWFSTNPDLTVELNYNEKLIKIKNSLSCWECRRLTLFGKITVLKSLIASQLVYILSPLTTNHRVLREINRLFYDFLWNGKGDKIKREVMINDYEKGGLKMIDIESFNKGLKTTWVKKYTDVNNHGKWKHFFDLELRNYGGSAFFSGNLSKKDLSKYVNSSYPFIMEILNIWTEITYENNTDHFRFQSLWHNSLIRIDNRPIFYKKWQQKGINRVSHLMKDSDTFLSFSEFKDRYGITETNYLAFYGLLSALKKIKVPLHNNTNIQYESFYTKFMKASKPSRQAYKKIIGLKQRCPTKSQEKWATDCAFEAHEPIDWSAAYQLSFQCTKSTKLIVFQFKLLHRRLATNDFLKKVGIKDNDLCSFCKTEKESLIHLFWSCRVVSTFWQNFKELLVSQNLALRTYNLSLNIALGLRPDKSKNKQKLNFNFLVARYYIWSCRTRNLSPEMKHFSVFLACYNSLKTGAASNDNL